MRESCFGFTNLSYIIAHAHTERDYCWLFCHSLIIYSYHLKFCKCYLFPIPIISVSGPDLAMLCNVDWKMEALQACYGDGSSDSDSESTPSIPTLADTKARTPLPPPPITLLDPLKFLGMPGFKLILLTHYKKDTGE